MSFDTFLKIDGIYGESTDFKHSGWIEVIRFGIGVRQQVSKTGSSAGGATAERSDFSDFKIRKLVDKSTPIIALACAHGAHIDQIILEICRAGAEKMPFMIYTMKNCIVSRQMTTSGSDVPGNFPAETVHINFGRIVWRYVQQSRSGGGPIGNIITGWDIQRNSKI